MGHANDRGHPELRPNRKGRYFELAAALKTGLAGIPGFIPVVLLVLTQIGTRLYCASAVRIPRPFDIASALLRNSCLRQVHNVSHRPWPAMSGDIFRCRSSRTRKRQGSTNRSCPRSSQCAVNPRPVAPNRHRASRADGLPCAQTRMPLRPRHKAALVHRRHSPPA